MPDQLNPSNSAYVFFANKTAPLISAIKARLTAKRERTNEQSRTPAHVIRHSLSSKKTGQMYQIILEWERGCDDRWSGHVFNGKESEGWQAGWKDVNDAVGKNFDPTGFERSSPSLSRP